MEPEATLASVTQLQPERSREVLTFLFVGGLSAAVNFGAGEVVRQLFPELRLDVSVAFGFAVGTVVSFVLNRKITFRVSDEPVGPQAVRFLILAAVSWVLGAAVADLVLRAEPFLLPGALLRALPASFGGKIAHFGSIAVMTVFNYFGMKLFAMRRAKRSS